MVRAGANVYDELFRVNVTVRCVLMSTSHRCAGRVVHWSQSGPQHGGHVSVCAVDPQHQGQGDGHEGPGDALSACKQGAASAGRLLQLFTQLRVVPGGELEQLVQEDDGKGDLQHHHPLGGIQRGDLEDDLGQRKILVCMEK